MAKPSRIISALLITLHLGASFTPTVQAQPAKPLSAVSTPDGYEDHNVAPGRENLEPAEPGFDDNTVDNQAGKDWHPTVNPQSTLMPGQMRSDKEEIPGGFTKEQANRAEVQEAKEQAAQARSGIQTFAVADTCRTYWPSPFKVCGKIREKYDSLGGPQSFLTWPKSDELKVPDGVGRRNEFVNGFIYWHPNTGAHPITTHFSVAWARTGWEGGPLGYPTSDEFGLSDGIGRKQSFEHGHIYGSLSGLATIHGAIYDKWVQTGAEEGPLGYPTEDETRTPDGIGRFNNFTGGKIYWHPQYGAHDVRGLPLLIWQMEGYEQSKWGYPIDSPTAGSDSPALMNQRFSRETMDVQELFKEARSEAYGNKTVNSLLMKILRQSGISFWQEDSNYSLRVTTYAGSKCQLKDSSQEKFGGVTIPGDYDSWVCIVGFEHRDHSGRHDYCMHSPDEFPSPGTNAEFSGACARHDMCMDQKDVRGEPYGRCNNQLWSDMEAVCTKVYSGPDPRRYGCRDARDGYWAAVTAFHLKKVA